MTSGTGLAKLKFGPFEFDGATGELRRQGMRVRLQTKPAQMLAALLENPGQVVTRDELRQRLWPDDTWVDFESGLNSAAKRLRDALGDSADEPKYVETLHRSGYRFVGEVEPLLAAVPARDPEPKPPAPRARPLSRRQLAAAAGGGLAAGLLPSAWVRWAKPRAPRFQQITYQRAAISSARFGPDGQTVLYSAAVPGGDPDRSHVFVSNGVSPEARPLGNRHGVVVSVSRRGELALLAPSGTTPLAGSALSRAPMNGGEPREVGRSIMSADWDPQGTALAMARASAGRYRLEYPEGKILFETPGWLSNVRVSRGGERVAFVHHPVRHDDAGSLEVVESGGKTRTLVRDWPALSGAVWHPTRNEVWFTGSRDGSARSLWAASLDGQVREVFHGPGSLTITDIGPDGRVLLARGTRRLEMAVGGEDIPTREITWYDWSRVQEVSADGSLILFDESGDGVAGRPVSFLYRLESHSAVRLGEGRAMGLSPDGRFALLLDAADRAVLRIVPVGAGEPRLVPSTVLTYQWARLLPGMDALLALANEKGQPLRLYRVELSSGKVIPIGGPTVVRNYAVSPDGREIAMLDAEGRLMIYPLDGTGGGRQAPVAEPVAPLEWTPGALIVQHARSYTEVPARLSRLDLKTGALTRWREIGPVDSTGVNAITRVVLTAGMKRWVFNYRRVHTELFVAHGLA